jgi:hypothetical protein
MSRYPLFDRSRLQLKNLRERGHVLAATDVLALDAPFEPYADPEFPELLDRIIAARRNGRPVIAMMGAHAIKLGLSRYFIDLIEQGLLTHVAVNGAGVIHDYELALGDGTSESVPKWIRVGQFGLWTETGRINDIVNRGAAQGEGLGEAVGRTIEEEQFPRRDLSIMAAAYRVGIPFTVHVGIGSDIIHAHANCDGAAVGAASYTDFLMFAKAVEDLEGGVFLNIGSAVTGPEVYLKALSMARNIARQEDREIRHFTTAVFDLIELPPSYREGPPSKEHAMYYYRPWKTILVRTVADGGESYYFSGDHRTTIPTLWKGCTDRMRQE